MKKYLYSILVFATCSLVGCTSSPLTNHKNDIESFIVDQNLAPVDSFESSEVLQFRVMDDHHIAIKLKSKHYFLTTPSHCKNMYRASKIILTEDDDGIVRVNVDKVIRLGDKYTECTITGMYKLHPVQLQQLTASRYGPEPNPS
ncbi:DUF6491 family protein [uncultured Paraglaciecola sp.]|uniref:DUF6491 family protein n=1 Tax=uncultured Paraglaciecola sp. TaxID=1765024 RepID=UPI00262E9B9B|nr:DUF6491 family protein [uncultured Paraglaciecola sp.]